MFIHYLKLRMEMRRQVWRHHEPRFLDALSKGILGPASPSSSIRRLYPPDAQEVRRYGNAEGWLNFAKYAIDFTHPSIGKKSSKSANYEMLTNHIKISDRLYEEKYRFHIIKPSNVSINHSDRGIVSFARKRSSIVMRENYCRFFVYTNITCFFASQSAFSFRGNFAFHNNERHDGCDLSLVVYRPRCSMESRS